MHCPKLTKIRLYECWLGGAGEMCLQAPLEDMQILSSNVFCLHDGFPLSNMLGLTRLTLSPNSGHHPGIDEALFKSLTLMTRLQLLDLSITCDRLTGSHALPASLREIRLHYWGSQWDGSLVPVLQQLPAVEVIWLDFGLAHLSDDSWLHGDRPFGHQELDFPLSPFKEMKSLRVLHLGSYRFWKPEAMRQLGIFEAELARSRRKLRFTY